MIIIGLGANLDGAYGSPERCLMACPKLFSDAGIKVVKFSSIWKSAPVPVSDQPWYRNAVCTVETSHSPHELLSILAEIENNTGRTRSIKNEARVIDLDILSYNDKIISDDILTLPHPRMHERAFVLYPLQEIAPNWVHPALDKSVDQIIINIQVGQDIERCQSI